MEAKIFTGKKKTKIAQKMKMRWNVKAAAFPVRKEIQVSDPPSFPLTKPSTFAAEL